MENFKYYIKCMELNRYLKSTCVLKYGMYKNKYPESIQICHLFFIRVCKTGHLIL